MKKFAFLALLFFIYYIAGMYQNPALMVLFLTQLHLMAVMFILSVYLNRHLRADFADRLVWAEIDRPFTWKLRTQNSGRLPVSRFVMKFTISQKENEQVRKRKVSGSSDCGEESLVFEEIVGHCGILTFQALSLNVFDYLALFSRKQEMQGEMEVAVFPRKYETQIEMESVSAGAEEQHRHSSLLMGNNSYEEIRQIREYRDGDPIRHIHWNQTARTDQMWVKEYEEETRGPVRLFLDPGGEEMQHPDGADRFYTLLYALLSGLLQTVPSVRVFWKEKEKTWISVMEVNEEQQCRELLFLLYQTMDIHQRTDQKPPGAMRLTGGLSWYAGDRLIFRFSKEKLLEELTQRTFRI